MLFLFTLILRFTLLRPTPIREREGGREAGTTRRNERRKSEMLQRRVEEEKSERRKEGRKGWDAGKNGWEERGRVEAGRKGGKVSQIIPFRSAPPSSHLQSPRSTDFHSEEKINRVIIARKVLLRSLRRVWRRHTARCRLYALPFSSCRAARHQRQRCK